MRAWMLFTASMIVTLAGLGWAQSIAWRFPEQTDRQLWLSHPVDMVASMALVVAGAALVMFGQRRQDVEDDEHVQDLRQETRIKGVQGSARVELGDTQ